MNILVLTSVYPQPDDNGTVVTPTVKYFCEKWVEANHNVVVIHNRSSFPALFYLLPEKLRKKLSSKLGFSFPTYAGRKPLHREDNGVNVYRLPLMKIVPHGKYSKRRINKQLDRIEKILDELSFKPDVIISHWVNPQIQLLLPLKEKYKAITSIVIHTDCSSKNINRFNMLEITHNLDAIGCRNKTEAEYVKDALFLDHMPFICYSGIPDEEAEKYINRLKNRELNEPCRREYIYVGRLVKYKNVDVIIKALAKAFPDKNYRLHVVGDGAELEYLKELDQELTDGMCTVFHGQLPRQDVFDLMEKCNCFIMVSDNETFGMVYLEAMLTGCLTIASEKGGIDGVIVDGENGFLSKQGDVEALVSKLKQIDLLTQKQYESIRHMSISTAYKYRDSDVAQKYLEDVLHWKQ